MFEVSVYAHPLFACRSHLAISTGLAMSLLDSTPAFLTYTLPLLSPFILLSTPKKNISFIS